MTQIFLDNSDLVKFINVLIEELKKLGEETWAIRFQDALSISFMPGELLGAIRLALLGFQKTQLPQKTNLELDINEAIKVLDDTLGYWRPNTL